MSCIHVHNSSNGQFAMQDELKHFLTKINMQKDKKGLELWSPKIEVHYSSIATYKIASKFATMQIIKLQNFK